MSFYNPTAAAKLVVDVIPHGFGAVLTQQQQNWKCKLIVYGSRALTDNESRYSQPKWEALRVLWTLQHFN